MELPTRRFTPTKKMNVLVLGLGFSLLSPCGVLKETPLTLLPLPVAADVPGQNVPGSDGPQYGPPLPTPEELEKEIAEEFAASLGVNAWLHPLSGPTRRMPLRTSRAFGADRPGHRPHECRSGHCGLDLGGTVWGEPILASSDGVAIRVNRDPSRSGGKYVRLSHRDGTVFTQYFHLAAIPRWLRKGTSVRAGQTIGLLGETGVENSGPHLHYTVSIKANAEKPEVYVEPEPLIALWPLRLSESSRAIASGPGVPIGATGRYKSRKRKRKKHSLGGASSQGSGLPSASEPAATTTTNSL
jgi:murein DD-endopeptidase MepM/ murein hydrolase activator NlpD